MRQYTDDSAEWNAYLAEGNAEQARKRVAAKVIIRDSSRRILLVDPTYKPDWDLPGGMAEANEAPLEAARREVREELGLEIVGGELLIVDWASPHGPWDDTLVFIFNGGMLGDERATRLEPMDAELAAVGFFTEPEAAARLRPYVWRRVEYALDALAGGRVRYLHDGSPTASD
jgi:ADP-ribose pyrophosphatase YjhB (NUDIX family)